MCSISVFENALHSMDSSCELGENSTLQRCLQFGKQYGSIRLIVDGIVISSISRLAKTKTSNFSILSFDFPTIYLLSTYL